MTAVSFLKYYSEDFPFFKIFFTNRPQAALLLDILVLVLLLKKLKNDNPHISHPLLEEKFGI